MNMDKVELIIDGVKTIIHNVKITFNGRMDVTVDAMIPQDTVYNHPNCKSTFCLHEEESECKMSELKEIPENLESFLDENFKSFYQLGWVDTNLNLTDEGRRQLGNFLFKKNVEAFGKHANVVLTELKKKEKESK